jgi:hypothetical protein
MRARWAVLLAAVSTATVMLAVAGMAWAGGDEPPPPPPPDAPYDCGTSPDPTPPPGKKPKVYNVNPEEGCVIEDTTPTVRASVTDGNSNLAKKHIRLFFDGTRKTGFSYNRSTDELVWVSPSEVSETVHTVKVVATDRTRKKGSSSWFFCVGFLGGGCNPPPGG